MTNVVSERLKAIGEYIDSNQERMLDDLKAVVQINSPSEYPEGTNCVGEYLINLLNDLDIKIEKVDGRDCGQHIIVDAVKNDSINILFCGHMDTVFPLGTEWPFRIENGRAYGPGVIDMKSGIIALIYALKALHFAGGVPIGYKILLNSDEELGSADSKKLIPDLLKNIDFACVMEPAEPDGKLIVRRKGIGKFDIYVTGRAAHAGKSPETGINAILEIAHQIITAENLSNKELGTTMNTGLVSGGQSAYIVPETAQAVVESRVWTLDEQYRIEASMQALTKNMRIYGTKIKVEGDFHRPPLVELPGTKILTSAAENAARELGVEISFGASGAASDGNNISKFNIPVLDGLGPVGGREHSHDEYMELYSLFERTKLIAFMLIHLYESNKGSTQEKLELCTE